VLAKQLKVVGHSGEPETLLQECETVLRLQQQLPTCCGDSTAAIAVCCFACFICSTSAPPLKTLVAALAFVKANGHRRNGSGCRMLSNRLCL